MSLLPVDPVAAGEACLVSALNGEACSEWILKYHTPEERAAARAHFALPSWVPRGEICVAPDADGSGDVIRIVVGAHETPTGEGAIYVETHRARPADPAQRRLLEAARTKAAANWARCAEFARLAAVYAADRARAAASAPAPAGTGGGS